MKNKIFKTIKLLGVAALIVSCESNSDLNLDPNSYYTTVPSSLITYSQKGLGDYLSTPSVNTNNFRLILQYWQETTYTEESNYDFVNRNISNNVWASNYRDVMQNLVQAKIIINDYQPTPSEVASWPTTKKNQLAIIDLMQSFVYQNLVDTYGDIPYQTSNDLSNNPLPAYTKASDVYTDLITRVKADVANINVTGSAFGSSDVYYHDDLKKWVKFGNSLLLKLGITIADANPTLAQSTVNTAIAAGVMSSHADDCVMAYESTAPNFSQLYSNLKASGRNDFVGGKTLVDYMLLNSDARIEAYFDKNLHYSLGKVTSISGSVLNYTLPSTLPPVSPQVGDGVYNGSSLVGYITSISGNSVTLSGFDPDTVEVGDSLGFSYYFQGATIGSGASFTSRSHIGAFAYTPETQAIIMNYTEVAFYLAEAAARWNPASASAAYDNAVTASFEQWGYSAGDAAAYLAVKPYDSSNWKKSIGEQVWVAMFDQGSTGWNTWRRLDYPVLVAPSTAVSQAEGKVPVRLQYPVRETTTNPTNYAAAAASIGGDKLSTKVFWDKF